MPHCRTDGNRIRLHSAPFRTDHAVCWLPAFEGRMNCSVATAGAIGCNLGSLVAYEVGVTEPPSRRTLRRLDRWGRRELPGPIIFRAGHAAVFVARLLPVVRTFIALLAKLRVCRAKFHIYTFGIVAMVFWSSLGGLKQANWRSSGNTIDDTDRVCWWRGSWFVWSHWKNRMVSE